MPLSNVLQFKNFPQIRVGLRTRGILIIWVSLIFAHLRAGKFSRKFVVYFVLNIRFRLKIRKPIINFSRYILPIANVLIATLSDKFRIQSRDFLLMFSQCSQTRIKKIIFRACGRFSIIFLCVLEI